jgi:hypothetical protein
MDCLENKILKCFIAENSIIDFVGENPVYVAPDILVMGRKQAFT